jgi:hypothetical protein
MTTEELEELVYRQRSAEKLTKALAAEPAPSELLLDVWVELQDALLNHCQDSNERLKGLKRKTPPDEFLPCGNNQVKIITHGRNRSFSLHLVFEPEARRIRWHSGERRDEFSIAVQDGKPCLLSRLHDPHYTIEEAGEFLYVALIWARY